MIAIPSRPIIGSDMPDAARFQNWVDPLGSSCSLMNPGPRENIISEPPPGLPRQHSRVASFVFGEIAWNIFEAPHTKLMTENGIK
jgi:hypothetical protein